jgi:signal transduction histidine kinase
MTQGGVLTVGTHLLPDAGDTPRRVAIWVRDTGVGIPDHLQARVFEPFFTTKPVGEGSGLGLSIVYGFVKQSGGDVSLKSSIHQGTMVTLCFPVASPQMLAKGGAS